MRYFLIFVLLFSLFISCKQQSDRLDWKSDIEFLKKELPKKHKDFFAIKQKVNLRMN